MLSQRQQKALEAIDEYERKEDIRYHQMFHDGTHAFNSLIITNIFFMFSMQFLKILYEEVARYILLPASVICDVLNTIYAYRIMVLSNYEGHAIAKFVIEAIATLAIATAVVGGIAFSSLFTLAGPIIFTATFGSKALFHLASSIYFGVKATFAREDAKQHGELVNKSIISAASSVAAMIATAAVVGVMFLGQPFMAIAGIAAGLAITTIAIIKCVMLARTPTEMTDTTTKPKDFATTHADIQRELQNANALTPSQKAESETAATVSITTTPSTEHYQAPATEYRPQNQPGFGP